jgi:hypothetical protein
MSEDKRIQLEDDPAFYWEMMCKNLARENHRLMERLVQLEDLNRWRDSRNEPPNEQGNYLVITNEFYGGQSVEVLHWNGGWPLETFRYRVEYWRPIGPLPGEGGE